MTKEEQFVNELIGYIFAYPDDDYMTMECLCRKLLKYGLIDKKDGEWTTDFIDRKDEPTISKMEQVEDEPSAECKRCKHFKHRPNCGLECEYDTFEECNYEPKTEPPTERSKQMSKVIMVCVIIILTCNLLTHYYLSKRIDELEKQVDRLKRRRY